MTKSIRAIGTALTALFLLFFLGALGLRFWASGKASDLVGPDHIAAGNDKVFVHVNGELFVLSAAGEFFERKRTPALIDGESLIDMRVLQDGRLLLARRKPGGFFLCDPDSWDCSEVGKTVAAKLRDQHKVVVDEEASQLLIADFLGSRVWMQPLAGGEPTVLNAGDVRWPNDIALDAAGRVWIADSGNYRLTMLEKNSSGEWALKRSLDARHAFVGKKQDWPMMLVTATDGNWWVAQPSRGGEIADVIIYHPEKGAVARVELPPGAYPTDLVPLGDAVLVTDRKSFQVYQVDVASKKVAVFGDAKFRDILERPGKQRARYEAMSHYAMIALIAFAVLMILSAFLAGKKGERFTKVETAAPLRASAVAAPVLHQVYWLRRNPKTERFLRWIAPFGYVAPVVLLGMMGFMYFFVLNGADDGAKPERLQRIEEFKQMMWVALVLFGGLPFLVKMGFRSMRHRLGTDGRQLFVKLVDGPQIVIAPEQLVYDARRILYKDYVFPIGTGHRQPLYEKDQVETFIAPLLSRATKLDGFAMFRYQLAHRERMLMASMAFLVLLVAAIVITGAWQPMWAAFLKKIGMA